MNEQLNSTPEMDEPLTTFASLDGDEIAAEEVADTAAAETAPEGGEETSEGPTGPEEYVEREKGERRRVGSDVKIDDVTYKNVPLLSRFLDRRGRIMSRRKTRVSAKMQRRIVREVKRARHLALLPYTADQTRQVRRRR